jgi:hypothetical protein
MFVGEIGSFRSRLGIVSEEKVVELAKGLFLVGLHLTNNCYI